MRSRRLMSCMRTAMNMGYLVMIVQVSVAKQGGCQHQATQYLQQQEHTLWYFILSA